MPHQLSDALHPSLQTPRIPPVTSCARRWQPRDSWKHEIQRRRPVPPEPGKGRPAAAAKKFLIRTGTYRFISKRVVIRTARCSSDSEPAWQAPRDEHSTQPWSTTRRYTCAHKSACSNECASHSTATATTATTVQPLPLRTHQPMGWCLLPSSPIRGWRPLRYRSLRPRSAPPDLQS